jgi:hypothetical protein
MDPDRNAGIAAVYLADLQSKGFIWPDEIDVYNVGETSYAKGGRNTEYVSRVKQALDLARARRVK